MLRDNLTIEELKMKLNSILEINDLEEQTRKFTELKKLFPFVREEEPYKKYYWDAIKIWHTSVNDAEKSDPSIRKRVDSILINSNPEKAELYGLKEPASKTKSLYPGYTSDTTFEGKKIKNFGLFLESVSATAGGVQKEVKKIISEMFAYGKNIKFSGDQNGEPQYVEFEVDKNDFKMDYDQDLFMEYSENVLKKRKYKVALKYRSKKNTGTEEKPVYTMKFKINLKSTEGITSEPKKEEMLAWGFEDKPTKVLNFIKGEKQKCKWDSSSNVLSMTKSAFDKCATEQLRNIIRDSGGEKVRI